MISKIYKSYLHVLLATVCYRNRETRAIWNLPTSLHLKCGCIIKQSLQHTCIVIIV